MELLINYFPYIRRFRVRDLVKVRYKTYFIIAVIKRVIDYNTIEIYVEKQNNLNLIVKRWNVFEHFKLRY